MTKKLILDYGTNEGLTITRIHFDASLEAVKSNHPDDNSTTTQFDCNITHVELIVPYRVGKEVAKRETSTFLPQAFINSAVVNQELLDYVNDNVAELWAKID